MTEKTLTPGEISKTLDVTGATVRNYTKRFDKFLSPDAKRKTRKRFSTNDVKVLQNAKAYLDDGFTYDQVVNLLESQPLDDILDQPIPQPDPEPVPDETSALMLYRETIDAKDAHISDLQKEIKWLRTPWYKKVFRDPPN